MKPSTMTHIQIVDKPTEDHVRGERKTLHVLQAGAGIDKENLVGGGRILQSTSKEGLKPKLETTDEQNNVLNEALHKKMVAHAKKRQKKMPQAVEKEEYKVTVEDLTTTGNPSEGYWRRFAEKRQEELEKVVLENVMLRERIALLEEENATQKIVIEETNGVLDVLREMVDNVSDSSTVSDISTTVDTNDLTEDPNCVTEDTNDVTEDTNDVTEDDLDE